MRESCFLPRFSPECPVFLDSSALEKIENKSELLVSASDPEEQEGNEETLPALRTSYSLSKCQLPPAWCDEAHWRTRESMPREKSTSDLVRCGRGRAVEGGLSNAEKALAALVDGAAAACRFAAPRLLRLLCCGAGVEAGKH